MRIFWKVFLIISLQLLNSLSVAAQSEIESVGYGFNSEGSRVVFNVSTATDKNVFVLDNPPRLVVDFKDTDVTKKLPQPAGDHPYFSKIRAAKQENGTLRLVLDLKKDLVQKNFTVAPRKNIKSYRLVVDLFPKGFNPEKSTPVAVKEQPKLLASNDLTVKTDVPLIETPTVTKNLPATEQKAVIQKVAKNKDVIIAIDAGHGGVDTGARGPNGTEEKRVVFAIAKRLESLINSQPGMRAVMVRKGDYYIKLRERMNIARQAKADLFISIHADAFQDTSVKGASVYTLSTRGASSEAALWLANHENSADLIGGVSLDDKDDVLASVLLDLSQTATKEASRNVAAQVLKHFKTIGEVHKGDVQKAAFAVLKSPDIPSILVETAFISNPSEERKLRNNAHQDQIATAVFRGVVGYFKEYAPAATRVASAE